MLMRVDEYMKFSRGLWIRTFRILSMKSFDGLFMENNVQSLPINRLGELLIYFQSNWTYFAVAAVTFETVTWLPRGRPQSVWHVCHADVPRFPLFSFGTVPCYTLRTFSDSIPVSSGLWVQEMQFQFSGAQHEGWSVQLWCERLMVPRWSNGMP